MWRADDKILEELGSRPNDYISHIVLAADTLRVDAIALADVHLMPPSLTTVGGIGKTTTFSQRPIRYQVERARNDFRATLTKYLHRLQSNSCNIVVNCGDLLDARQATLCLNDHVEDVARKLRAAKAPAKSIDSYRLAATLRYYDTCFNDVAIPAISDALKALNVGCSNIISVPGNHDVYREGALRDLGGPDRPPKHYLYYNFVEPAFNIAFRPSETGPPEEPCFLLLQCDVPRPMGAMSDPMAYIAIVGFDSNLIEYEYNHVTTLGKVPKTQLTNFETKLMPALAKITTKAPLYVVVVLHHNLLPIENRTLSDDLERETLRRLETLRTNHQIRCVSPFKQCLGSHVAASVGVSMTVNTVDIIEHLQRQRVSLVLHGHMHDNAIHRSSSGG